MSDKRTQTRKRILSEAGRALFARGPLEPSVSEVMAAAGLTVGGFYTHFDSKEALMAEAFGELLRERRQQMRQIDSALAPRDRRALAAAFYLSRRHRDSTDRGCPLPGSLGEVARNAEPYQLMLAEHLELLAADLAGTPEDGDKALADIALMVGGLALARALGAGELSDRILRAARTAVI
ncbi:TetR/AcrR family transcriptional regulator [Pseudomonas tohonis]|nr:TetR/AcrR family transcriptional regulator [Pseudomonas tohonis]